MRPVCQGRKSCAFGRRQACRTEYRSRGCLVGSATGSFEDQSLQHDSSRPLGARNDSGRCARRSEAAPRADTGGSRNVTASSAETLLSDGVTADAHRSNDPPIMSTSLADSAAERNIGFAPGYDLCSRGIGSIGRTPGAQRVRAFANPESAQSARGACSELPGRAFLRPTR